MRRWRRFFVNEYDRRIDMNGFRRAGNAGVCDHVIYNIKSPNSRVDHTLTFKEAEQLRDLLIEIVGAP